MADVDRARWMALDPLLDQALELGPDERALWLAELRAESPTIAAELTALLAREAVADRAGFLAEPLTTTFTPPAASFTGLRLGGYSIERQIGQGGMGSVWLARRVDGRFEGHVAVKFLNLALLGEHGRERFRREGTMLARLAHPGIGRLLDAGVADGGQPCLVLEYIEGEWIDTFADARRLDVVERIRLVLQVLSAVDHAHARLIVHRDLKPSNILVTADGTTKLLDFGIAKLLGDEERTSLTNDGARALTPEFAAPEQLRGDSVTTATDVYAIGVLLYLLLTGRRPYEVAERSLAEVERIVTKTEPPRASATFRGSPAGAAERGAHAHARGSTPERLQRLLSGDLDAIVAKAMHKEPGRRYQSAEALAEDLQRFLDRRPVVARPDSPGYRLRKFVSRHRGGVAVAAVAAVLVVGGGLRERALRARAEGEARKARAVEEYLTSVFDVADPYATPGRRAADVTARALLDRGVAGIDSALAGQPDVQAELRGVLGRVYANLGLYDEAAPLLRRALEQRLAEHGPQHPTVAEAMDRLGQVLVAVNKYDEAEPLLRDALAQRRALLGPNAAATAESLDHVATLLQERGKLDAAEPLFREAVAVRRATFGPDNVEVAYGLNNLAVLLFLRGEYDAAEPLDRQAVAIDTRWLGENHPRTAEALHNLAQVQYSRGHYAEAESLYRRALAAKRRTLGDLHPSVTVNLNNLGLLLAHELGRPEEAEQLIREALALDRRMFGERHSYVAESMRNLATVLRLRGDFDEAERIYRQTLDMNRELFGPEHARVAKAIANIAQVRHQKGDLAGAIPLYREALAQFGRLLGERHRNYIATSVLLARALREQGDAAAAETMLRATISRIDTTSLGLRPQLMSANVALGEAMVDQRRAAEALPVLERALAMTRQRYAADDWPTGEAQLALGRCLVALGRIPRAEPLLREAAATLARHRKAEPLLARRSRRALAALPGAGHA